MTWTAQQRELIEKLTDEVSYILGEPPGSQKGLEIVLLMMKTLEDIEQKRRGAAGEPE